MPCLVPVELGKITLRKMRREKAKWKNDVRPLPRRRNSLSIAPPSPPSPFTPKEPPKHKITPNDQLDSALLTRLPLELRLEIYAYVFGGTIVHLVQIPRRIAHSRCRLRSAPDHIRICRPATRAPLHPRLGTIATANVALLKTCRMVYSEAAPVLYAANTFDVCQQSTFIGFSRTIVPNRLAAIRSLHLDWYNVDIALATITPDGFRMWRRTWSIIANDMHGLRHLSLFMGTLSPVIAMQEKWLAPLCQVRGLRRFELSVEGIEPRHRKEMAAVKALENRLAIVMTSDD